MQRYPQSKLSMSGFIAAVVVGLLAAFITAAAASWSDLGGSLLAVAAPAFVVGICASGITLWRMHVGESLAQIWRSVKELWHEFGKSGL